MKTLKYILLSIALIVIGLFMSDVFFEYSFSKLNTDGVFFNNRTTVDQSFLSFLLPVILGIIPFLYALVKKITEIKFLYKGLLVSLIILCFGIIFWRLRIYGLNVEIERLLEYNIPNETLPSIEVSYLKFDVYLCIGFIVGTLISILLFRDRTKSLLN